MFKVILGFTKSFVVTIVLKSRVEFSLWDSCSMTMVFAASCNECVNVSAMINSVLFVQCISCIF